MSKIFQMKFDEDMEKKMDQLKEELFMTQTTAVVRLAIAQLYKKTFPAYRQQQQTTEKRKKREDMTAEEIHEYAKEKCRQDYRMMNGKMYKGNPDKKDGMCLFEYPTGYDGLPLSDYEPK